MEAAILADSHVTPVGETGEGRNKGTIQFAVLS